MLRVDRSKTVNRKPFAEEVLIKAGLEGSSRLIDVYVSSARCGGHAIVRLRHAQGFKHGPAGNQRLRRSPDCQATAGYNNSKHILGLE